MLRIRLFDKCPHCGSIWVCWNWMHHKKEDLQRLNPWNADKIKTDVWAHECWYCGWCHETSNAVKMGIPHWLLKIFGYRATAKGENDPRTFWYYDNRGLVQDIFDGNIKVPPFEKNAPVAQLVERSDDNRQM